MSERPPRRAYTSLQGVDRAFAILDLLAEAPLTASQVCERLGLSWTTGYRALASLEAQGILLRDGERGAFRVGPRLHRLGLAYIRDHAVVHAAAPTVRVLASELAANVQLNERDGVQTSVLMAVDPKPAVIPKSTAEYRFPLHAGSNGQVILAFSEPRVLAELLAWAADGLPALTAKTVTDPGELEARLEGIRERGYAVAREEVMLGSGSLAVPLFGATGELAGALCAIVDLAQLNRREDELVAALLPAAQQVSRALGWSPGKARPPGPEERMEIGAEA